MIETDPKSPASRLRPCRRRPNCVSTEAPADDPHFIEPIPYRGSPEEARRRFLDALRSLPRTRIVREEPGYVHAKCRSRVFRFVDDVEAVFDDAERKVRFRSAARLGRRDFGVNRDRMERLRRAFLESP
jgi:uncharacterized protein (DUF1499 family)